MAFVSEVLGLMVNNPIVYNTILNLFGKVEFKHDLCIKVHGLDMYSYTPDRLLAAVLWKLSLLENYETKLLQQLIKPGIQVVDIGANIGYYSLILSSLVGRTGTIIAFEPDPGNYRLLKKNLRCNQIQNVTTVPKAISNRSGRGRLYLNKGHRGDHRLFDPDGKRASLCVETTTLDEYLAGQRVDVVKMDIQGAELIALQGMQRTIAVNPRLIILTEFSPHHLFKCGSNPKDMLNFILSAGFHLNVIDEKRKSLQPISKSALLKRCTGMRYENLLLRKNSPPIFLSG